VLLWTSHARPLGLRLLLPRSRAVDHDRQRILVVDIV
jgi:hypothetical protein